MYFASGHASTSRCRSVGFHGMPGRPRCKPRIPRTSSRRAASEIAGSSLVCYRCQVTARIDVRPERHEDVLGVRRVNELAFGQPAESNLVDALRAAGAMTLSLVAVRHGEVVGHVAFSPVTVADATGSFAAIGLAPVAVLPELQGQGIGTMLVHAGLAALERAGHHVVFVLGHPAYYPRFGFVRASLHGIRWEHDARDDALIVVELAPGALAGRRGVVSYRREFANV